MTLTNGIYKTPCGSRLEISGKHSGIAKLDFNWLEEAACIDCVPEPYPEHWDTDEWRVVWTCTQCDGGSAIIRSDLCLF